jgi:hypothetical protein
MSSCFTRTSLVPLPPMPVERKSELGPWQHGHVRYSSKEAPIARGVISGRKVEEEKLDSDYMIAETDLPDGHRR